MVDFPWKYPNKHGINDRKLFDASPPPPKKKPIFVGKGKMEINAWEDSPKCDILETL
jgi:hypothetical protein